MSLDGWQQVMWHTQDAAGDETWVFFVVVLVIGNAILVSVSKLPRLYTVDASFEGRTHEARRMCTRST